MKNYTNIRIQNSYDDTVYVEYSGWSPAHPLLIPHFRLSLRIGLNYFNNCKYHIGGNKHFKTWRGTKKYIERSLKRNVPSQYWR